MGTLACLEMRMGLNYSHSFSKSWHCSSLKCDSTSRPLYVHTKKSIKSISQIFLPITPHCVLPPPPYSLALFKVCTYVAPTDFCSPFPPTKIQMSISFPVWSPQISLSLCPLPPSCLVSLFWGEVEREGCLFPKADCSSLNNCSWLPAVLWRVLHRSITPLHDDVQMGWDAYVHANTRARTWYAKDKSQFCATANLHTLKKKRKINK